MQTMDKEWWIQLGIDIFWTVALLMLSVVGIYSMFRAFGIDLLGG